jgi:hypothetical protein
MKLKSGKAPGIDEIRNDFLKFGGDIMIRSFVDAASSSFSFIQFKMRSLKSGSRVESTPIELKCRIHNKSYCHDSDLGKRISGLYRKRKEKLQTAIKRFPKTP